MVVQYKAVMAKLKQVNPFRPGEGSTPPHLAGREEEKSAVSQILDVMEIGEPPPANLILYGPRGNGKTCLLTWIATEAQRRKFEILDTSAAEIESVGQLVIELTPRGILSMLRNARISVAGVSAGADMKRQDGETSLKQVLAQRTKKRPLVILIDEAHILNAKVGLLLFNAAQVTRRGQNPLLLVLAGTPGLMNHLRAMEATFIERSEILPLQPLGEKATKEAIQVPLEKEGYEVDDEVLEKIVRETQGYPYFLQLWGKNLWEEAKSNGKTSAITNAEAKRAKQAFDQKKERFYQGRREELRKLKIATAAAAVASAYANTEALTEDEINKAIAASLSEEQRATAEQRIEEVRERLVDRGYIWAPRGVKTEKGMGAYVPGIPSLMTDVLAYHRQAAA